MVIHKTYKKIGCPVSVSKNRVDTLYNKPFFQEDEGIIMPVSGIGQNEYQCYCTTKALILHDKSVDITSQKHSFYHAISTLLYFVE